MYSIHKRPSTFQEKILRRETLSSTIMMSSCIQKEQNEQSGGKNGYGTCVCANTRVLRVASTTFICPPII